MQEMDPPRIVDYFNDLRTISGSRCFFYCCNREEKKLPDGTITRVRDYPWLTEDLVLIDELCPWHQFYYTKTTILPSLSTNPA